VAGALWGLARLPALGAATAAGLVVAALVADVAHWRSGRLRPLSLRRQVPRAWGRLFDPRTAAALYGARLGVGPLTHLPTWTWWAATVLAASLGPLPSVATGATFGAVRMATVVATSRHVEREMAARMASLRARERMVAPMLAAGVMVASVAAASPW
ncbi:MAG TPA: hypothetical protein VM390_00615, partial [Acidimicrobiales bacterium]|nr:hypothetical protein [Acidimicrobiales bacterium]